MTAESGPGPTTTDVGLDATTTDSASQPPGPLVDALRAALDGRWGDVREELRDDPAIGELVYPEEQLTMEEYRERTLAQLPVIARTGAARQGFTVAQGGTGEAGASVTAFETLGCVDLSLLVKAGVQFGLFGGAIANLGTHAHHAAYLPRVLDLSLLGCFAMSELGHGSDVQSLRTTLTHDPETDEIVVDTPDPSARKEYIGNAARDGRTAAVFGRLLVRGENHGVHCVLVPIRDADGAPMPGVTIGDCGPKEGLPGVDNGRLSFDHVRVPRADLLDRYGRIDDDGTYHSPIANPDRRFFTMLGTLVRGRVSVGAGAGAAARTGLALAVTYADRRRQFSAPGTAEEVTLLDYRAHQRRLLPALARSCALAFAQNALVEALDAVQSVESEDEAAQRALEVRAAAIKVAQTAHASRTLQTCREACGGAGYLLENRIARIKADLDVFTTFEGDNTVLLQLVAKGLLTHMRDAFHELDTVGTILFGARQFAGAVVERTTGAGVVQRLISGSGGRLAPTALTDRGGQLDLFEDRERHLVETVAARLRRVPSTDDDPRAAFAAFNAAQDHLLEAALAHADRIVLEAFVAAIDGCDDPAAADLLGTVCDLFALSTIEEHRAWYLEHGRLTTRQSKDVVAGVNALCATVRPHARTLVDAFGIPAVVLDVPMLRDA
ncbi:acyl-CoA dehydrogenase family protein [Nostocoides japonicum]|nr:acyl-CoA dehydrogenase [Tetrasphaera japonica]